jgi:parallel beta-helix repeat protein
MSRDKICLVILALSALVLLIEGCTGKSDYYTTSEPEPLITFPETKPDLNMPVQFELQNLTTTLTMQTVEINQSVENYEFQDCEVWLKADGIEISNCLFENSIVFIDEITNIVFNRVILQNLNQYERATLNINNSQTIVIRNSKFIGNYIGLSIHSSDVEIIANRFKNNNGHNALVIGEGSTAIVTGNYFYGNYPHAILIMNREAAPEAVIDINENIIDQTGEDAIDFEDYRNAAPSVVSNNIITNSGWSAVLIEYNSWQSNITVEDNWIENTGIDWKLPTHNLQTDSFQPGWGHGILVEDSDQVNILNNRILSSAENGIEIRNGRYVRITGNGIDCSKAGIGAYRYNEHSFHKDFSPLAEENAGDSQVIAKNNVIYSVQRDYDINTSCQLILLE